MSRKPQFTFCVSVRPWLYSDMHIWVPFLGPEGIKILGNEVMSRKPQSAFCVSVRPWFHLDMHVWVPSFWTLRISGNSMGAIWTFAEGTGLL